MQFLTVPCTRDQDTALQVHRWCRGKTPQVPLPTGLVGGTTPPARDLYLILQIFCQQAVKKNHLHKIKHIYIQINNYKNKTQK